MLTPEALGSQSCGDSGGAGRPGWPRPQRHGGQRRTAECAWPRRLTALSRPPCRHVSRFRSRPGPSPLRFSPAAVRPSSGLPCAVAGDPSVSSAGSDARLSGPCLHRQGTGRARGSFPPVTLRLSLRQTFPSRLCCLSVFCRRPPSPFVLSLVPPSVTALAALPGSRRGRQRWPGVLPSGPRRLAQGCLPRAACPWPPAAQGRAGL